MKVEALIELRNIILSACCGLGIFLMLIGG